MNSSSENHAVEGSMSCCQMLKFSLSKLIMEFTGTLFFTMFFTSGAPSIMLLGLWILTIFFWKISGSHFNPAVSFAFMFRKDEKRMPWKLALSYMVAQALGGFVGALLINFYTYDIPELTYENDFIMRAILQEFFCCFMYVFFFMANTDEKLLFSNEQAINCFILAASYVGARAMFVGNLAYTTSYGAVINPAVAIGIQMSGLLSEGFSSWNSIYLYPTVPFAAAFVSVLFYELVYKKTQAFLAHEDGESESDKSQNEDHMGEHD